MMAGDMVLESLRERLYTIKLDGGTYLSEADVDQILPVFVDHLDMWEAAAAELCGIYFDIASNTIGEDEVRRLRDLQMDTLLSENSND